MPSFQSRLTNFVTSAGMMGPNGYVKIYIQKQLELRHIQKLHTQFKNKGINQYDNIKSRTQMDISMCPVTLHITDTDYIVIEQPIHAQLTVQCKSDDQQMLYVGAVEDSALTSKKRCPQIPSKETYLCESRDVFKVNKHIFIELVRTYKDCHDDVVYYVRVYNMEKTVLNPSHVTTRIKHTKKVMNYVMKLL